MQIRRFVDGVMWSGEVTIYLLDQKMGGVMLIEKNNPHISGTNKSSIMKGITKPAIEHFKKIISSEQYIVPRFQRNYSWKEANWNELWQDAKSILEGRYDERFMGYLVLLAKDDIYEIIDGQQRLTTISIMFLAFIENMKQFISSDDDTKRKIDVLKRNYIAEQDTRQQYTINLRLNENNNDLYASFVTGIELSRKKLNSSEVLLKKCFTWFTKKISELNLGNSNLLADAVNNLAKSFYFSILHVTDDLNAYIVFETLNARGVKLSSTDLLKNYLFQKISELGDLQLKSIESKWKNIVQVIGNEDLVDFIRYYWNSRNKIVRAVDLYREITKVNETPQSVTKLIDDISISAPIYAALNNPYDDWWEGDSEVSENLQALKIFKIKQAYVPLLIGYEVLDIQIFKSLLKCCVAFSLRYNIICNFSPNEQEVFYNNLAVSINKNKIFKPSEFKDIYPDDIDFRNYFKSKEFLYTTSNVKIIRYILASIERQIVGIDIPLFSPKLTIEHILPQSPSAGWKMKPEEQKKLVNRLGNLTILSKAEQKQTENLEFKTKAPVYLKSPYEITNKIVTTSRSGWDRQMIEQRQDNLALKAISIWSIAGLK